MLQKNLEKLGFEKKEAVLYTALLELGEASIVDITRKSGLKRTTVYHTLESLKTRGLISQTKRKKESSLYCRGSSLHCTRAQGKRNAFSKDTP